MKARLIELLSQVQGNRVWAQQIREHIGQPTEQMLLNELRCAALDNGAYFQKFLGKEAYELLIGIHCLPQHYAGWKGVPNVVQGSPEAWKAVGKKQ